MKQTDSYLSYLSVRVREREGEKERERGREMEGVKCEEREWQ